VLVENCRPPNLLIDQPGASQAWALSCRRRQPGEAIPSPQEHVAPAISTGEFASIGVNTFDEADVAVKAERKLFVVPKIRTVSKIGFSILFYQGRSGWSSMPAGKADLVSLIAAAGPEQAAEGHAAIQRALAGANVLVAVLRAAEARFTIARAAAVRPDCFP
jgi:hypothetical protein